MEKGRGCKRFLGKTQTFSLRAERGKEQGTSFEAKGVVWE